MRFAPPHSTLHSPLSTPRSPLSTPRSPLSTLSTVNSMDNNINNRQSTISKVKPPQLIAYAKIPHILPDLAQPFTAHIPCIFSRTFCYGI
jgi:hypothetical protein